MYSRADQRRWAAALAGATCALVGAAGQASAQTAQPQPAQPSREELNPDQRGAARPQTRNTDLFSPPSALPCPLDQSKVSFTLQGVDIAGSSIPAEAGRAAYADLVGQTVPVSKICEIRDRLSSILFHRGLLARVEVPEQTISGGRLRLEVIEARIVAVRVRGDIGAGQDKVEAYLEKLRGLTPFDLDTAQRYLLLANEVPGVSISAALRPSAAGRGAIDLEVQVNRDPVDVVAAIQNTGSKSLGPWSGLARVDLNSFTGFGERTTLIAYHTLEDNEQWIVQLVEEARLGGNGLVAKASVAYGQSRPGDLLAPLKLRGESAVVSAELRYPLIKLRRYSVNVGAGVDAVDQSTKFPGGGALSDDKLRILWTHINGEASRTLGDRLGWTANGEIELRKGFSGLGASKAGDPDLSRIQGKPDAWTVRLEAETHLSSRWLDLGVRGQAQYAKDPLLSYEEQAIGGLTIGRGYEPAVLSGDRAAAVEVKLQLRPLTLVKSVSVSPFAFFDASYVDNLDAGSQSRTLRSTGLGFEARLPYGLRTSLAWAEPLDKPYPTQPEKPSQRVVFQLVLAR